MRIQRTGVKYWERNWKKIGGCGDEGDNGWGYGQGPSGYSGGIDRRGIGSGNALGDGKNDRLDGNVDGWMGGELVNYPRSTKTLLVGGLVLHQTSGGKTKLRCWRTTCAWIGQ